MIIFNFIFFELLDKTGTVLLNSKMVNQFSAMTFPTGLDSIPTHQLEFPVIVDDSSTTMAYFHIGDDDPDETNYF